MKQIQISETLFKQLVEYHLLDERDNAKSIHAGLSSKLDAAVRRQLYTASKVAPTPEEREAARQAYLNEIGLRDSFRYQPFL